MPARALCYLCDKVAIDTPAAGEAPMCRRCVLAAREYEWEDEPTDPGIGPVEEYRATDKNIDSSISAPVGTYSMPIVYAAGVPGCTLPCCTGLAG